MRANRWANKSEHMGAAYNILTKFSGAFCIFPLGEVIHMIFDLDQGFEFPYVYTIRITKIALGK
jgi:hypothetical protein